MALAEALASLPGDLDRDFARRLLITAERNFLGAYLETQELTKTEG